MADTGDNNIISARRTKERRVTSSKRRVPIQGAERRPRGRGKRSATEPIPEPIPDPMPEPSSHPVVDPVSSVGVLPRAFFREGQYDEEELEDDAEEEDHFDAEELDEDAEEDDSRFLEEEAAAQPPKKVHYYRNRLRELLKLALENALEAFSNSAFSKA